MESASGLAKGSMQETYVGMFVLKLTDGGGRVIMLFTGARV